ncbi:MAG: hypothetical protein WCP45_15440 [Verrucomicrobiota bacterium]
MKHIVLNPLWLLAALLCQCGAPQPPRCTSVPFASRAPAATLTGSARESWQVLARSAPARDRAAAQATYNAAVGKLFDQLRCGGGSWDARAAALGTRIAPPDARHADLEKIDALFPAALVGTAELDTRRTSAGMGIALVGWKKTTPVGTPRPPFLLPTGLPYPVTATLDCAGAGPPVWHFFKRWLSDDTAVGARREALAADWSAPNAFYWQMSNLDDLKIQNVLLPDRFSQETGLYFLQPYDPEKIPVVLIHGLVSSPDAFKITINELAPEPWFRQHYQIWLYNYPTGSPWLYSSMRFRELMRQACAYARTKGATHKLNQMVIVGHSMGGIIARSSVTKPGSAFYDAYFHEPIEQLKASAKNRGIIRETTLYQPLPEPRRVVFMAVPHRGSPAANFEISVLLSKLIQLPKRLSVNFLDSIVQTVGSVLDGNALQPHLPTSINSLAPDDKTILALGRLPLPAGIAFHSIIGDRGKGDTPHSSDGVVPYESSHITPVASEKIVPCNHSVPHCPATCEELKRILKLHLNSKS